MRAIVLGVNGQDGSYLAEALLRRNYRILGLGRQGRARYVRPSERFRYVCLDLQNFAELQHLLADYDPDLAFHTAAVHGPSGFSYEPVFREAMAVNVLALHVLLEHARSRRPDMRIVYANSSKIFPAPWQGTLDETTARAATCLYSVGKMAAANLIEQYRARHAIPAGNLFLFNHESVRRPTGFFVPTVARALAAALAGRQERATLRTLSFRADWSSASELMDIAIDIAEKAPGRDFVLGSGTTWHAREAIEAIFRRHGLDYRRHIAESEPARDPGPDFRVSMASLQQAIGRKPAGELLTVLEEMLRDETRVEPLANRMRSS